MKASSFRRLPGALAGLALALAGCRGKLLSKAELRAPGTATVRFTAASGQSYKLWADTEGVWKGSRHAPFPVAYTVDVQQGGKSIGKIECETQLGSTAICGSESNTFGEHEGDCEYSLDCKLPKLAPGEVVLQVEGRFAEPARVKKVKNMSLMVREG